MPKLSEVFEIKNWK